MIRMQKNLEERDLREQRHQDLKLLTTPVTNYMSILEQKYTSIIDDHASEDKQPNSFKLREYFGKEMPKNKAKKGPVFAGIMFPTTINKTKTTQHTKVA